MRIAEIFAIVSVQQIMNEIQPAVHTQDTHEILLWDQRLDAYCVQVCQACYSTDFLVLHSTIDLRQCLDVTMQLFVMLKLEQAEVTWISEKKMTRN